MSQTRQPTAVIAVDGVPYFLARNTQGGAPEWHPQPVATQEGDPTTPQRRRFNDWSRGMGDSRGAFQGSVESSTNAWLGSIGRILPGPKVSAVATTGKHAHDSAITSIVEVSEPASRIISFGGQYAHEVDPSAGTISVEHDFGSGKSVKDAVLFIDQLAIAMGDGVQFQRRDASGSYHASTIDNDDNESGDTSDYESADCFGIATDGDLARGRGVNWSKCSAADFYSDSGNWTVEYPIGDQSGSVTRVGNFERWDYVLKAEGLYTFDQDTSNESNVLPDLAAFKSAANANWFAWYNRLFICSLAGLYRYIQQGGARTVGIEEEELNESFLDNVYPTAGAAFGKWAYVAYYDPGDDHTYLCVMRNARDGDATLGSPFTVVSVIDDFDGQCLAMTLSSASGVPCCYYGADTELRYFEISRNGRPVDYRDSGTATVTFAPSDLGSPMTTKYFRSLEVVCRNASADQEIAFEASMDEAAFAAVDDGITSAGFQKQYWTRGTGDSGRLIQLKASMALASSSEPPEIRDVILNYEERPDTVRGAVFMLRLRDFDSEGEVTTRKTAYDQLTDIEGWLDGSIVEFTDPYGETYAAAISRPQGDTTYQRAGELPQENIVLAMRRMDYAD